MGIIGIPVSPNQPDDLGYFYQICTVTKKYTKIGFSDEARLKMHDQKYVSKLKLMTIDARNYGCTENCAQEKTNRFYVIGAPVFQKDGSNRESLLDP